MTREEIVRLRQIAFRRFYGRPRFLIRRLLSIRTIHDLSVSIKGLRSLVSLYLNEDLFKTGRSGQFISEQ